MSVKVIFCGDPLVLATVEQEGAAKEWFRLVLQEKAPSLIQTAKLDRPGTEK